MQKAIPIIVAALLIALMLRGAGLFGAFSRLCLLVAVGAWIALAVAIVVRGALGFPQLIVLALIVFVYRKPWRRRGGGVHGTAKWARPEELAKAGTIGGDHATG